jgi:nucleoid-associated protein YgaU
LITVLAAGVCAGVAAGRAGAGPEAGAPDGRARSDSYVVRPGDTVWEIARDLAGDEGDPRPVVAWIIDVNHLSNAVVLPGQALLVPA